MAWFRCENPNSSPAPATGELLIAEWNFKESLVDSVAGFEVQLQDATRDSQGIHLNSGTSKAFIPGIYIVPGMTLEFKLGALDLQVSESKNYGLWTYVVSNINYGLFYRATTSNSTWSVYGGSSAGWKSTGIAESNGLSNCKITTSFDVRTQYLKVNDVEVLSMKSSLPNPYDGKNDLAFGNSYDVTNNLSFFNAAIESLKITFNSLWAPSQEA